MNVTPLSEWKSASVSEVVELPSGNRAELRRSLNMLSLIRQGIFTDDLMKVFDESLSEGTSDPLKAVEIQDIFVCEMFVAPAVTNDPDEADALFIDDLDPQDIEFVLSRAIDSVTGVDDSFRHEPSGAGAGDSGEDVGAEPKSGARAGARKRSGVSPGPSAGRKARKRTAAGADHAA